jgi:hypothetical protein
MSLADIGVAMDRQDPDQFVRAYLLCLGQGFSMTCPTATSLDALTKEWGIILAKYRSDFTDEFCTQVVSMWLELLTTVSEPSQEMIPQLCHAAGVAISEVTTAVANVTKEKTAVSDIPVNQSESPAGLTPAISDRYRQRQQAEAMTLPEKMALETTRHQAFVKENSVDFLVAHLAFSKHDVFSETPKSSVPQTIRAGWESILADLFDTIASDDFLERLTNDWFYLVNQKGIPTTSVQQADILMTYLAKSVADSEDTSVKKPLKRSLFKRLFGR